MAVALGVAGSVATAGAKTPHIAVPPTVAAVGALASQSGTGNTTLSVAPQHVGDLLALALKVDSSSNAATSVLGGGVSLWTRSFGPYFGYGSHDLEIWLGTVSTAGSSTLTVNFGGVVPSVVTAMAAQEFSSSLGSGTKWSIDIYADGGIANRSSSTLTFPDLTPHGTDELYFGYGTAATSALAGTTSGFSYATASDGDVVAYDTDASTAVEPTASLSSAGIFGAVASFITASSSTVPTVTHVGPRSGPDTGGTVITIKGTNFTRASAVHLGTVGPFSFTVDSDTKITATTSDGGIGTTDVTITTPAGTSAVHRPADRFTYCVAGRQHCHRSRG